MYRSTASTSARSPAKRSWPISGGGWFVTVWVEMPAMLVNLPGTAAVMASRVAQGGRGGGRTQGGVVGGHRAGWWEDTGRGGGRKRDGRARDARSRSPDRPAW
ncbi:hypothetical protein Shyhy01_06100 [Streptomyces hygroscopicus subsp. hygroscopicus]|nr:hypothetical protein Shyhy01_06100 [Streptomyces hygroscopicus subsp. hygroscopicus]